MSVLTSIPEDGFLGADHCNNSTTAAFPIGTKVAVKQDAATGVTPGYCTFIYYIFDNGSDNIATLAKGYVQLELANTEYLTSDYDESNVYGPGAISLAAYTTLYGCWFQCGGPICNGNATALAVATLDTAFLTDGSVAAGTLCGKNADTTITSTTSGTTCTGSTGWILSDTADTSDQIDAEFLYLWDKFAA